MAKVITVIRETTGETFLLHPTVVEANGDLTKPIKVMSWGTDLLGMAKQYPNERFFLKNGKYSQYISFGEWQTENVRTLSSDKFVETGTRQIGIGLTVNNLHRSFGRGASYPLYKTVMYSKNNYHATGQYMGLYFLVNQYNCVWLAQLPTNVWHNDTSVPNCNYRVVGQKESSYQATQLITDTTYSWGYRGDQNFENMNKTPQQIEMTAEQFASASEIQYAYYVGWFWYNYQNTVDPDDPVKPLDAGFPYGDNPSSPNGGDGYMETESTDIDTPDPSESNALDGGMVSLFNISKANLQQLASFLWSDTFINAVKGLFTNKGDVIVGLSELPVSADGETSGITLGDVSSGISAIKIKNRYYDKDFGEIDLKEYWGNFMDYAPYTKIELVLPYAESVMLNTDLYQNKKVTLKCRIDLLTGDMLYIVGNGTSAVDFIGANCNAQIPLASKDYADMVRNALTGVSGIASSVATGNVIGGVNSALSFISAKPSVSGIGSLVASRGNMGIHTPFIRITRPTTKIPNNFPHQKGFRSNITARLGDLTGYTKVDTCHLDGITCTASERDLIMQALTDGVIIS